MGSSSKVAPVFKQIPATWKGRIEIVKDFKLWDRNGLPQPRIGLMGFGRYAGQDVKWDSVSISSS
jgi:hypothetical protein